MELSTVTTVTSLLVQLYLSFVRSEPVSVYVRQEAISLNFIYVNFYKDMLQRMYTCMADMSTTQCNAKVMNQNSEVPYHPEVNYKVIEVNYKVIGVTQTTASSVARGYFTCQFNQSAIVLECIRNTGQCGGKMCTSFRFRNSPMCECVYLLRKYSGENVVYDKTDNLEDCNGACTEPTTMYTRTVDITKPSSYLRETSWQPSEVASDATENSSNATNIANSGSDSSSSNIIPIIIGVVCGVIIISIILLVGIIYRRTRQLKMQANNTGVGSSQTHTDHNRIPAKPRLTRISNGSNEPVVFTLSHSHDPNAENGDLEDGYDIIGRNSELSTYQNELNMDFPNSSHTLVQTLPSPRELIIYQNEI